MSTQPDPTILRKLEDFSRRRRNLILLRGAAAAVATLLATMMIVALVDWAFVLQDWQRWTLSGLAYAVVIIAEWRACLRLLLRAPDARELARLIEHAEPELREDLLSAVELGQTKSAFDSQQFRNLVQADVANRVQGLNIDRLLPVQLLRRSLVVAAVVLLCGFVAFIATGAQLGTLLVRAMLPMANVARVSKVKVAILEPKPAEGVVPQGDSVPLVVALSGPRTTKAVLETFSESSGRQLISMSAAGDDQFRANLHVGREDLVYRVRAGDAITRKYQLRAAPRPHVEQFQKTYHPPAYTKLPVQEVTEEHGDLIGLEGSTVDLKLQPDQPVRLAELRLAVGDQKTVIPMKAASDGHLSARVPITASGTYRVHLIAAETGFENKFSPEFEIRADPDLVPQVTLDSPKTDLIVPPDEIVDLRGTAEDDHGLAKVGQMIRINDGDWQEVSLGDVSGTKSPVERRWDLLEQGVRPGDVLVTKLTAIDSKGSRAESSPIQISITRADLGVRRLQELAAETRFLEQITRLREAAETLEKRGREAREGFERAGEDAVQRRQQAEAFRAALDEFEPVAEETKGQLHGLIAESRGGSSSGTLVMLARLLSRMNEGAVMNARHTVAAVAANASAPFAKDLLRESADACSRGAHRARLAHESFRTLYTAAAVDMVTQNAMVMDREQQRIAALAESSGEDARMWEQLAPRLRVTLNEMRSLEELLNASSEHASDGAPDRFRRLNKDLEKHRDVVEKVFRAEGAGKQLLKPLRELTKVTEQLRRHALDLRRDFTDPPRRAYEVMQQESQHTWVIFEKLRHESDIFARDDRFDGATKAALMRARWDTKSQHIDSHGDAEEVRPDADHAFVGDVLATTLALEQLREQAVAAGKTIDDVEGIRDSYGKLDPAVRLLELAHNVAEVLDALTRLSAAEQWQISTMASRTANPREWEWLERRLRSLPDELAQAGLREEPVKRIIEDARDILRETQRMQGWRRVDEEMRERFKGEREPQRVSGELAALGAEVQRALELLRPAMAEARRVIAGLNPDLSERMTQLSKEARKMAEKSREQGQEGTAEPAPSEARQQLAEQEQLNERIEALKDAIRNDANQQNMLEEEGRERARDADDALAMLQEPPPKAAEALAAAAAAADRESQQTAMEQAANEQEKLASALQQLAEHYAARDEGNPEPTRTALRAAEEALGLDEALDEQYAKAEQLAEMAQANPEDLLKQLEAALPQNPGMQQELSQIAMNTLDHASGKLAEASAREEAVAREIAKLAKEQEKQAAAAEKKAVAAEKKAAAAEKKAAKDAARALERANTPRSDADPNARGADFPKPPENLAQQSDASTKRSGDQPERYDQPPAPNPKLMAAAGEQSPIAEAAGQAGAEVARAGRHEQRLQNSAEGRQLEKLGEEIQETAQQDVARAQQALAGAAQAQATEAAVKAASTELERELRQLREAQNSAGSQAQPGQQANASRDAAGAGEESRTPGRSRPGQIPRGEKSGQSPGSMRANNASPGEQGSQGSADGSPTGETPSGASAKDAGVPSPSGKPGSSPPGANASAGQIAALSPQEQIWMARTLDALDAAMNGRPGESAAQGQGSAPGPQPASKASAMAQAQQAMNAAAQAASSAMSTSRSKQGKPMPGSPVADGGESPVSEGGTLTDAGARNGGALPEASMARTGEWGKLRKQAAEDLTQGQREGVAGEYRNQVETYYRVLAERAKKR